MTAGAYSLRHGHQSKSQLLLLFSTKYLLESYICTYIFMKAIFKTNVYDFHIYKLNDLKVIYDLYSQCLTQTLSETTSNTEPDGV
jgi:hypothetical protein